MLKYTWGGDIYEFINKFTFMACFRNSKTNKEIKICFSNLSFLKEPVYCFIL